MAIDESVSPEKLPVYLIGDRIWLVDAFPEAARKNRAKYLCDVPLWGAVLEAYNDCRMAPNWSVFKFKNILADVISSEIKKAQDLWDALSAFDVPFDRKNQIVKETANEEKISAYEDVLRKVNQATYIPVQRDPETQCTMLSHQYLVGEKFDFASVPIELQLGCISRINKY